MSVIISESEFCEKLGISVRTAQRLRKAGRLGYVRVTPGGKRGRVVYSDADMAAFLNQREAGRDASGSR